jgi:hypothetical protein
LVFLNLWLEHRLRVIDKRAPRRKFGATGEGNTRRIKKITS